MGIVTFSLLFCWCRAWCLGPRKLSTNIQAHKLDSSIIFCETHVGLRYTLVTDKLKNKQKKVQFVPFGRTGIRHNVADRNGSVSQMSPEAPAMSDSKNLAFHNKIFFEQSIIL